MTRNMQFSYNDLKRVKERLRLHGIYTPSGINFKFEDAETIMCLTMQEFLGNDFTWLPEYDEIADWLTDTKGKGLLPYGSNGVGKTVMCRYVIPGIFDVCFQKVVSYYDYYDMNKKADDIMAKKYVSIDDIGNEEQHVSYGSKQWILPQLVDRAEKNNNLLILTTNLTPDDLLNKYGTRTLDRIKAVTRRIKIKHKSFRA